MVSLDDVVAIITELPEVTEGERYGHTTWSVGKKHFAWDRPFSKADLKRFGDATPPTEPILAVKVADLHDKEALLAAAPKGFFTIPHFDGYPGVLIELRLANRKAVKEAIVNAWLGVAPTKLAEQYRSGG